MLEKQTYDSVEQKKVQDLIAVLSDPSVQMRGNEAKASHKCKICCRPAIKFKSDQAKFEYSVSAICQRCQDRYLLFA